ncbi:MAG: holo-ACP synthase [Actinobacteria bacterium]|nr:holo-ACP synthase [Actinomycetota bacterium]
MRVGVDIVQVERLAGVLARQVGFRDRIFTPTELADARRGDVLDGSATEVARLAARFAAKEATRKALGDLQLGWQQVEVRSAPDGAPVLYVRGEPSLLALSLSHDGGVAIAFVAENATLGDAAT